ncbi:hypothetical protein A4X06_0g8747 [Tilletia controversa]|uniref:Uncharacterized protein n=1 Tax=Tilletia controversa TaxID=13291 RepID=A0A8X7SST0_9BASI|nr:hypothetical protein A4X06_0g8747 [Tilletia controversa]
MTCGVVWMKKRAQETRLKRGSSRKVKHAIVDTAAAAQQQQHNECNSNSNTSSNHNYQSTSVKSRRIQLRDARHIRGPMMLKVRVGRLLSLIPSSFLYSLQVYIHRAQASSSRFRASSTVQTSRDLAFSFFSSSHSIQPQHNICR